MINGKFGISYTKKNGKTKMLQYGISYFEDKQYFNINYLKDYYNKHLKDASFMKLFIKKYYSNLHHVAIFSDSLNYINYAYNFIL